jgi:serine/threonine protein kinase
MAALATVFAQLTPEKAYAGHNDNFDYGMNDVDINFRPGVFPRWNSRFTTFCQTQNRHPDQGMPDFLEAMHAQGSLKESEIDPPFYPGLYAAYYYASEAYGMRDGEGQVQDLYFLMRWLHLTTPRGMAINEARSSPGSIMQGRWKIVEKIEVFGCNNLGILRVTDTTAETETKYIMKLLCADRDLAEKEINMNRQLHHPNIVKMVASELGGRFFDESWMVMELCAGGSLLDLAEEYHYQGKTVPESFLLHVFESLLEGVVYLHDGPNQNRTDSPTDPEHPIVWQPVLHRDLHFENVFLCPSSSPSTTYPAIKIGDIGEAEHPPSGMSEPEIESGKDQDIEELGRCMVYLWTGEARHGLEKISEIFKEYGIGSTGLANFIKGCYRDEFDVRPSAKTLLDWVKQTPAPQFQELDLE